MGTLIGYSIFKDAVFSGPCASFSLYQERLRQDAYISASYKKMLYRNFGTIAL